MRGAHYTNLTIGAWTDITQTNENHPNEEEDTKPDRPVLDDNDDFVYFSPDELDVGMLNGWITTFSDIRFMALYREYAEQDFSVSVELKPVEDKLADVIGIHVSEIPNNYQNFDSCHGYGVYLGDYNLKTGDITVRLSKSAGSFKGFIPTADSKEDKIVIPGLLAGADQNTTLLVEITVIDPYIQVRVSRTDDPTLVSPVIIFDTTATTTFGDNTPIEKSGVVALACNAELTGSHFANLVLSEAKDMTSAGDADRQPQDSYTYLIVGATVSLLAVITVLIIVIRKARKKKS